MQAVDLCVQSLNIAVVYNHVIRHGQSLRTRCLCAEYGADFFLAAAIAIPGTCDLCFGLSIHHQYPVGEILHG